MAEINNIKIGNTTPDAVMFDSLSGVYNIKLNEGTWEINDGWEVEFIKSNLIKITKFKIDTWGVRLLITNDTDLYTKCKSYEVQVQGLTAVNERVQFTKAYCGTGGYDVDWRAGKYTSGRYIQGLGIQGGKGYSNYPDSSLQMGKHPWDIGNVINIVDGFVKGSNFDGSYGAWTIGLFGGVQDSTSTDFEKIWDISDTPIIIRLDVNHINPASKECWRVIGNGQTVYNKDKTFENCWEKYGLIEEVTYDTDAIVKAIKSPDIGSSNTIYLPPLETLDNIPSNIAWQLSIFNTEYWETIKNWYANHNIKGELLHGRLFYGANISGSITLNIDKSSEEAAALFGHDLFRGSSIESVTFNLINGAYIGSGNNLFRGASYIKNINFTSGHLIANDLAGMFEWCRAIEVIPKGIIYWSQRGVSGKTHIPYFCDGCSKLITIEAEDGERDSDSNTISVTGFMQQAFYGCSALVTIGPILDFKTVRPHVNYNTDKLFTGCAVLTDVRIKNLNHGDWKLDGTGDLGTLASIDQDSVIYLFNNLTDLVSEYRENIEEGDLETPSINSANLYCPIEWDTYITDEMVTSANNKGWNIYIGGEKVEGTKSITITWIPITDSGEVDTSIPSGTSGRVVFFGGLLPTKASIVSRLNDKTQLAYTEHYIKSDTPTIYTKITTGDNEVIEISDSGSIIYACWDSRLSTYTEDDIYLGNILYTANQSIEAKIDSVAFNTSI